MESHRTGKANALRQVLDGLEASYGMSSADLKAARDSGNHDQLAGVPGFTQHAWAGVYEELHQLDAQRDGFAEHVEQELAVH